MALNFPSSPTIGLVHVDSTSGFSYEWDGVVWKSYQPNSVGNIEILDDISGSFNGITDSFPLTSIGTTITPVNAQQVRVVLGGVVQDPVDDYNVSGSNLVFTTPPSGGLSFSGIVFGSAIPINIINDGSITPQKLSTGGPSWTSSGDVSISGIVTASGVNVSGIVTASGVNVSGIVTASEFVKSGGTSSQFLKADGSSDGSTYTTPGKSIALSMVFG